MTGRAESPGIFEVLELLGRDRVLARIDRALALPTLADGMPDEPRSRMWSEVRATCEQSAHVARSRVSRTAAGF